MNLSKYLKVYKKFLHTSLASELEYKTNILVDLITAILSLIGSILGSKSNLRSSKSQGFGLSVILRLYPLQLLYGLHLLPPDSERLHLPND